MAVGYDSLNHGEESREQFLSITSLRSRPIEYLDRRIEDCKSEVKTHQYATLHLRRYTLVRWFASLIVTFATPGYPNLQNTSKVQVATTISLSVIYFCQQYFSSCETDKVSAEGRLFAWIKACESFRLDPTFSERLDEIPVIDQVFVTQVNRSNRVASMQFRGQFYFTASRAFAFFINELLCLHSLFGITAPILRTSDKVLGIAVYIISGVALLTIMQNNRKVLFDYLANVYPRIESSRASEVIAFQTVVVHRG